jgi:hypothetical protein
MISIAEAYSKFPAGRYPADGPFNGERFRNEVLIPAIKKAAAQGERVVVLLDGVLGYSSSFLEEVFGGLVRSGEFSKDVIKQVLEIKADDVAYQPAKIDAEAYIEEELRRSQK